MSKRSGVRALRADRSSTTEQVARAMAAQQWQQAEKQLHAAARAQPDDDWVLLNLAQVTRKQGRLGEAIDYATRALHAQPDLAIARRIRADCLRQQARYAEASEDYAQIADADCQDADLLVEAGLCFMSAQRFQESIATYLRAMTIAPDLARAHMGLGGALRMIGMYQEAAESFRTAYLLEPRLIQHLGHTIFNHQLACSWSSLRADLKALEEGLQADQALTVDPFIGMAAGLSAQMQLVLNSRVARQICDPIKPLPAPAMCWDGKRRLRVGYVSADFCNHATMLLWIEALELHDRARFEVFLYSYSPDDGSELRRRTVSAAEHFVEVGELSDQQAAQRIRDDQIDILIDLKGYIKDARPGIMAYRPAPIQAAFLAYPGTMGSPVHDYVISDAVVSPVELAHHYSEKIAQLPHCYQPNDRKRRIGAAVSRASQGLPDCAVVFCCFNQNYKITEAGFGLWIRILREVPGSVLWLLGSNPQAERNLRTAIESAGLDPARIVFAPKTGIADHLARLQLADLFLDTLPVNAHTTASDALWAGVPVLTQQGEAFAARVAASLVQAVGHHELVCGTADEYVRVAVELARSPQRLADLRMRLHRARENSPLFDSARYARDFEALLVRMAKRAAQGLPPDHLPADRT
jgi:protein O-GlcNAc transferase